MRRSCFIPRCGGIVNSLVGIHSWACEMPRSADLTRWRILDAAYRLFRRRGYTRVSMDEIAASAKVTKRTLYYHFQSKDSLLAAVLDAQHHLALAAFRTFGDSLSGSPEDIIEALFREIAVWSDKPRWAGSGFTRLVVELADLPGHPARLIARRHKAQLHGCALSGPLKKLVKRFASVQHRENHFHAALLRFRPLCCLQPVGNRITVCLAERFEEHVRLFVPADCGQKIFRKSCLARGIVGRSPTAVFFRSLNLGLACSLHPARLDQPFRVSGVDLGPATFRSSWGESLPPRNLIMALL